MSFEIFTEHTIKEEVRNMLLELKPGNFAISTLPKESIELYAAQCLTNIKVRKLKDGRTKVSLVLQTNQPGEGEV